MCCRYYMEMSPELREIVEVAAQSSLAETMRDKLAMPLKTFGEIKPTDMVSVIASGRSGRKSVFPMVWGYTGKSSMLFNARSETASKKPTFREDWQRHRCIVPASWYYEWEHLTGNSGQKKTGQKYILQPKGQAITWMCGLYRFEDGLPHFTVLTREASDEIRFIHDRMPVILPDNAVNAWIYPGSDPKAILQGTLTDMFFEKAQE